MQMPFRFSLLLYPLPLPLFLLTGFTFFLTSSNSHLGKNHFLPKVDPTPWGMGVLKFYDEDLRSLPSGV
jgi:hypothetical protein